MTGVRFIPSLKSGVFSTPVPQQDKIGGKYSILEPVIEGFRLNASREDADDLDRLEKICP